MELRAYEGCAMTTVMSPQTISTMSTLYNGSSGTVAGLDTQGYDGVTLLINTGTFSTAASVDVTVMESDTADSSTATAITGASLSTISHGGGNDAKLYIGYVQAFKQKRYLTVKVRYNPNCYAGGNAPIGIIAIMDRYQKRPLTPRASLDFVVDEYTGIA